MIPDNIATPVMDAKVVTLCDHCACDMTCKPVAALAMKDG